MATYKVLQDIEAEDKLVGPLTLRQFIYAAITAVCLYLCFIAVTKHVFFLIAVFLPPGLLTGFFAFPWGRDQPTEIWALAKIRFLFKPRRRVWDQSGQQELVTITAPKTLEVNYTNGLSQTEVRSRLRALADTIDTRGWAIKNVTNGIYQSPLTGGTGSERLLDISTLPQAIRTIDDRGANDMLDESTSSVAQNFNSMMKQSDQAHRQRVVQSMTPPGPVTNPPAALAQPGPQLPPPLAARQAPTPPPNDYWFMGQPPAAPTAPMAQPQVVTPGPSLPPIGMAVPSQEERALADKLREQANTQSTSHAHVHTVLPLADQQALARQAAEAAATAKAKAEQAAMTQQPDPAIIALASNNDLNVATIARQANRQNQHPPDDEVVIALH